MKHISELENILNQYFKWNKSRIGCFVQILQSLFYCRTVNLSRIAEFFRSSAKTESHYRRIQRFFKEFTFDMSFMVTLVFNLFVKDKKLSLIIDRTNWKFGKLHINIFMLSVDYNGIGIPLFWMILNSAGNTKTKQRIQMMQKVIQRIRIDRIKVLLADREFIGEAWFDYLISEKIPFVIRVKKNLMVEGIRLGYAVPIGALVKSLNKKSKKILNYRIILKNQLLYISLQHAKNAKEPMIVISNKIFSDSIKLYRKRWGIETLFGCLKTRGFSLEDTRMTDEKKIEKLLFILSVGFCWAYKTGEKQAKKIPILIKTHGRKAKSVFRVGMDYIRLILLSIDRSMSKFKDLISCFSKLKTKRKIL